MIKDRDPFTIQVTGGDIDDRELPGFSDRRYEGTGIPAHELASLQRAIHPGVTKFAARGLIVLLVALFSRLIWLQVAAGLDYRAIAEGNRIRLEVLPARRGLILDRQAVPLVANEPQFILVAIPADWPKEDQARASIFNAVKRVVDVSEAELIINNLDWRSYLPVIVKDDLTYDQGLTLLVQTANLPGLEVRVVNRRHYLLGEVAGHLLGYLGLITPEDLRRPGFDYQYQDSKGVSGIEAVYESDLRGQAGKREVEVNNLGRPQEVYATQDPLPGSSLSLTIDSDLQKVLVEAMQRSMQSLHKPKGAAIAIDPQTGEILALASWPTFDPNLFTRGDNNAARAQILTDSNQPLFNRVVGGSYPSGSTIKPVFGLAALTEGIITPNTTVVSAGGLWAGNRWFADWKAGGHGLTNIYKAIAESVNTFFYVVGGGTADRQGLGAERLAAWLRRFHFGAATGVDLPGEVAGLVPTPDWKQATLKERWFLGDTYNLAIGQGNFLTTPLQLAVAYAALINGGVIWQPHLVKVITSPSGESTVHQPHQLANLDLEEKNLEVITRAMRETVLTGSARSLAALPVAVAGKTGTAQTGGQQAPHAWFAGFIPYDKPRLLLVILVENGEEGSLAAVPVARQVFNWYASNRL